MDCDPHPQHVTFSPPALWFSPLPAKEILNSLGYGHFNNPLDPDDH